MQSEELIVFPTIYGWLVVDKTLHFSVAVLNILIHLTKESYCNLLHKTFHDYLVPYIFAKLIGWVTSGVR